VHAPEPRDRIPRKQLATVVVGLSSGWGGGLRAPVTAWLHHMNPTPPPMELGVLRALVLDEDEASYLPGLLLTCTRTVRGPRHIRDSRVRVQYSLHQRT
jgi:hypothetical protein